MKPAEKNSENKPVASPPNPERRRFLRDVLVAGALAPLACSSTPSQTGQRIILMQGRQIQFGKTSLVLTSCREGGEFPSASIDIYKENVPGAQESVSMIVPSSFKLSDSGFAYELYVERVSCGTSNYASAVLVKKEAQIQDDGKRHPESTDIFTIGAAVCLIGSLFFAIFERKSRLPDEGILLPPKRNH